MFGAGLTQVSLKTLQTVGTAWNMNIIKFGDYNALTIGAY
jgi:hypothetical protein